VWTVRYNSQPLYSPNSALQYLLGNFGEGSIWEERMTLSLIKSCWIYIRLVSQARPTNPRANHFQYCASLVPRPFITNEYEASIMHKSNPNKPDPTNPSADHFQNHPQSDLHWGLLGLGCETSPWQRLSGLKTLPSDEEASGEKLGSVLSAGMLSFRC